MYVHTYIQNISFRPCSNFCLQYLSCNLTLPLVKPRERQLYLTVLHSLHYFPYLLPSMDFTAEYEDGPMSEVGIFTGMSASEDEEHGYDKQLNQKDYYRY